MGNVFSTASGPQPSPVPAQKAPRPARICTNCGTRRSPGWLRLKRRSGQDTQLPQRLCNRTLELAHAAEPAACGLYFNAHRRHRPLLELPDELLDLMLSLAFELDWDEVDIVRESARRDFLRAAGLVCRRWRAPVQRLQVRTVVVRTLFQLTRIERAIEAGVLPADRVESLVLDEGPCSREDTARHAWYLCEQDRGGPVDRTSVEEVANMLTFLEASRVFCLEQFSRRTRELAARLPGLRQVRSMWARTLYRLPEPWPIVRLAVESFEDCDTATDEEMPDIPFFAALDGWSDLRALSLARVGIFTDGGLTTLPTSLSARLRHLRIGVRNRPSTDDNDYEVGMILEGHLFGGPALQLRSLELHVREGDRLRLDALPDRWMSRMLGYPGNDNYAPPVQRLVVGWPSDGVDVESVETLVASTPPSTRELVVFVSQTIRQEDASRFLGFDVLGAVDRAMSNYGDPSGLVRLELELRGYGLDEDTWRTNARWRALEATCAARGVELVLTA